MIRMALLVAGSWAAWRIWQENRRFEPVALLPKPPAGKTEEEEANVSDHASRTPAGESD